MHGQGFALTASRFREVECVLRLVRGRRRPIRALCQSNCISVFFATSVQRSHRLSDVPLIAHLTINRVNCVSCGTQRERIFHVTFCRVFAAVNMHRELAYLSILLTSWLSPSMKGSWTLVFPLFSSVVVLDLSLRRICRLITLFTNILLYPFSTMIVRIVSSSRSRMAFELHTLKARLTKHLMVSDFVFIG